MCKRIALFDLDGTLTPARKPATGEMTALLKKLRNVIPVAIVSGSDEQKVREQLQFEFSAEDADFLFVENGTTAYKKGEKIWEESLSSYLGEEKIKLLINYALKYLSELDIPKKRGTFIEYRCGMINFCPIGRSCTYEERLEFAKYDNENGVRQKMADTLKQQFPDMEFVLGGQISVDCFPTGWDKTYCLRFLESFDQIHFFGDKTTVGGNDFELFSHPRTIGHTVNSYIDTMGLIRDMFDIS